MALEVVFRHEKLAPRSGIEFMVLTSGASFWSVCQGPKIKSGMVRNQPVEHVELALKTLRSGAAAQHPWASCSHRCASSTKQYDLVPV